MTHRPKRKIGKLGFLTTAHGFSEDALGYPFDFENKRVAKSIRDAQLKYQQERRQERSKKIVAAFPDEILRRMARRAGISSLSQKDGVSLLNEVRKLADVAIFNIAKQCMFIADHQRKTTISEHILKTALATLDHHELACPGESELPKCKSLRQASKRKSGSPRRSRGTVVDKEIEHERGSSFLRLFRASAIGSILQADVRRAKRRIASLSRSTRKRHSFRGSREAESGGIQLSMGRVGARAHHSARESCKHGRKDDKGF